MVLARSWGDAVCAVCAVGEGDWCDSDRRWGCAQVLYGRGWRWTQTALSCGGNRGIGRQPRRWQAALALAVPMSLGCS